MGRKRSLSLEEIKEKIPEGRGIINSIIHRWKNGKLVVVAVNGDPGTGKSWLCMRAAELIYERIGYGKLENKHVIKSDIELLERLLNSERGTVLIIEEASVLFNSRRATSGENVTFSAILDTCRKKGIILFMNFPFSDMLDKHGRNMTSHSIEAKSLHKEAGMCLCRVLKHQYNDKIKKMYRKYLKVKVGNKTIKVSKVWFGPPENKEVTEQYEINKDAFLKELYEERLYAAEKKKKKKEVESQKKDKSEARTKKEKERIERDNRILELVNQKELTKKEIAKLVGITNVRLSQILREYRN